MGHFQRLYRRYQCLTGEGRADQFLGIRVASDFRGCDIYANCTNNFDTEVKPIFYSVRSNPGGGIVCLKFTVKNSIFLLIIISFARARSRIDRVFLNRLVYYSDRVFLARYVSPRAGPLITLMDFLIALPHVFAPRITDRFCVFVAPISPLCQSNYG